MNIAHKKKYELIQLQNSGGSSLIRPNPTIMKEKAKAIEASPDRRKNHRSGPQLRTVCAVASANAPTLPAITTKSRETGRKLRGPLTRGDKPISPNAPSARPCSETSQE